MKSIYTTASSLVWNSLSGYCQVTTCYNPWLQGKHVSIFLRIPSDYFVCNKIPLQAIYSSEVNWISSKVHAHSLIMYTLFLPSSLFCTRCSMMPNVCVKQWKGWGQTNSVSLRSCALVPTRRLQQSRSPTRMVRNLCFKKFFLNFVVELQIN